MHKVYGPSIEYGSNIFHLFSLRVNSELKVFDERLLLWTWLSNFLSSWKLLTNYLTYLLSSWWIFDINWPIFGKYSKLKQSLYCPIFDRRMWTVLVECRLTRSCRPFPRIYLEWSISRQIKNLWSERQRLYSSIWTKSISLEREKASLRSIFGLMSLQNKIPFKPPIPTDNVTSHVTCSSPVIVNDYFHSNRIKSDWIIVAMWFSIKMISKPGLVYFIPSPRHSPTGYVSELNMHQLRLG